jgi:hypothetical protein
MSAAWSQYVPERAEDGRLRSDLIRDARRSQAARLRHASTAPIRKNLKIGEIFPVDLETAGFGLRYSSLIWMLPQCYIEEDQKSCSSTEPMEGTDGRC